MRFAVYFAVLARSQVRPCFLGLSGGGSSDHQREGLRPRSSFTRALQLRVTLGDVARVVTA
jgi:hypothetical protein